MAGVIALTVAMVLTAIIAFAWLVWPTPWLYHTTQGIRLREHRWSGRMERLSPTRGWLPVLNTVEGGVVLEPRTAIEEFERLFGDGLYWLLLVALAALVLLAVLFDRRLRKPRGSP